MAGSTPIYGFPYPQSTDLVADYPALGQELATDVETVISGLGSGLNIIAPTSIANSGGSASASGGAVTATGVTSVSLNGVFTSTYDNYRIVITATAGTDVYLNYRLRASGTDATSNYNIQLFYAAGSSAVAIRASAAYGQLGETDTSKSMISIDIAGPALAAETNLHAAVSKRANSSVGLSWYNTGHTTASAYDGITIYPSSSTLTAVIRVYGYKNS